jgi:hypothetical protein
MTRYGILAPLVLAFGISANAQSAASNHSGAASVQAQANASATASAAASPQSSTQGSSGRSSATSARASGNSSASASANANGNSLNIDSGTPIQAALVTSVDAKHSKPGDRVVAKTTRDVKQDGRTVLKKGSRLEGHITQAEARTRANSESSVAMVFDEAVTKKGQHVPMNLSVQALASAANQTSADLGNDEAGIDSMSGAGAGFAGAGPAPMAGGGGGLVHGAGGAVGGLGGVAGGATNSVGAVGGVAGSAGHTVGGTAQATTRSAGSVGGLNSSGQLMSTSSGVFGLQGLDLSSAVSNGTSASVVNSTSRNVHLDSGTQMVLQVVR